MLRKNKKIDIFKSFIFNFFFKKKYIKNKIPNNAIIELKLFECGINWDEVYEIKSSKKIPSKPIDPKLLVSYFINFSFKKNP